MPQIHQLRADGQARGLSRGSQQLQTLLSQTLEGVGGGAGLVGTAPEDLRARRLDGLGNGNDLILVFHGAGARDHGEVTAADLRVTDPDDGVQGVELPVHLLVGFRDPLDALDDLQGAQQLHVHPAGVADETQDGDLGTLGNVDIQVHAPQPGDKVIPLGGGGSVLENCDHKETSPNKNAPHDDSCGALKIRFR